MLFSNIRERISCCLHVLGHEFLRERPCWCHCWRSIHTNGRRSLIFLLVADGLDATTVNGRYLKEGVDLPFSSAAQLESEASAGRCPASLR